MAQYTVKVAGYDEFQVEEGTKLAVAIEQAGIDISHRCGGNARCTTCRVKYHSEEPAMGEPEHQCLVEDGVLGEFRLACQIRVSQDTEVEVLMPVSTATWDNPGADLEP